MADARGRGTQNDPHRDDRLEGGDQKHEFHETVTFYFIKNTPNDAVTPEHQSQFTPTMKANAVQRLLSSLV